jgi:hypothetical protein
MPTRGNMGTARRLISFDNILAMEHQEPTPPVMVRETRPVWARRAPLWHKDYEKDCESSSITTGRRGFRLGGCRREKMMKYMLVVKQPTPSIMRIAGAVTQATATKRAT